MAVTHVPGSDAEFAAVCGLVFANLTAPVLAQMRQPGRVWASLVHIAATMTKGTEWCPDVPAGMVSIRLDGKSRLRTVARLRNAADTAVGPDEMAGRWLDVTGTKLADTLRVACVGRPIREAVDPAVVRHVVGDERIKAVEDKAWGTRFVLDLPLVQPTDDDLAAIRTALTPLT